VTARLAIWQRTLVVLVVAGLLALPAYGTRLLEAIAAHAPLELAAFAIAGGAYLSARRRPLEELRVCVASSLGQRVLLRSQNGLEQRGEHGLLAGQHVDLCHHARNNRHFVAKA